ncbi:MAG: hypothetical protein RBG13Loki_2408 [Promethearchaeota archaeon CR_4]|nr:MAG: hypothetical protein RBG13Loki_2408 [Candidatus Lokiarchaeota archaeon CR_4]
MTSEIQEYVSYVKFSFKDIIKAIALIILMGSGILLAIVLRSADVDGWSAFVVGSVVEICAFMVIAFFGKRGLIFKAPRQVPVQKSTKEDDDEE